MSASFDWGIRAGLALPMQGEVKVEKDFFIGIRQGTIVEAGKFKKKHQAQSKRFISAPGQVLLPGLVNAHTHLAMTLFRGLEDDTPLQIWLHERIFPLEAKFVDPAFVKAGTELAALECIRFGTTTVSDMYFFPEVSMKIWDEYGLRGMFTQALMSVPTPEDHQLKGDAWSRFEFLNKKYAKHSRLQFGLGPHALYTSEPALLAKTAVYANKFESFVHIHLAETEWEVEEIKRRYNKTPTEYLASIGLLGPRTICAHMVHLTNHDHQILQESGASVVHNPDSNMKLGSGVAPIRKFLQDQIRVAIGTDGSASNNDLSVLGAINLATKAQKLVHKDSTAMLAKQAIWMATMGGALALGLDKQIGSLEVGKQADLILVDFDFPHLQPVTDPISHLVYAAQGLEVDTVFCQGKNLLRNKKFVGLDTQPVFKKAEVYRKKIYTHLQSLKSHD